MNIAGALSEGVLQNPVNNIDDMGIIRFHLLELSQFEHLFKIAKGITHQSLCRRFLDRIGNRIKFLGVTFYVLWTGQQPNNVFSRL